MISFKRIHQQTFFHFIFYFFPLFLLSQELPKVLQFSNESDVAYLPDFNYTGYTFGEKKFPRHTDKIVLATDYGVVANDGLDDSKALLKALEATKEKKGNFLLQLPKEQLILSDTLYIEQSDFVLRGTGSGSNGTEIYCSRLIMYLKDAEVLKELREYLLKFDKRQKEPENNIDLLFSQYAWSGGITWTQVPKERGKSYLGKYDVPETVMAEILSGKRGKHQLNAPNIHGLKVGDVLQLQLFNKTGIVNSDLVNDVYKGTKVEIGSHHWLFPTLPIVRQEVFITKILGNQIY